MKRNLQGIALILFAILLTLTFNIMNYDTVFDLDLEWSHLFILLGVAGVLLNYIRPKQEVEEAENPRIEVKKTQSSRKNLNILIIIVLIVIVLLGLGTNIVYKNYREEKNVENFAAQCSILALEHDEHIVNSPNDYDFVTNYKVGNTGYGYMLDESLEIILHPNSDVIGSNVNDFLPDIMTEATNDMAIGDSNLIKYKFNGLDKVTYIYRDGNGNYLCIVGDLKYY